MKRRVLAIAIGSLCTAALPTLAQDEQSREVPLEEMLVTGTHQATYSYNAATQEMISHTSPNASVLDVVNNLPGVLVNEGGAFGGDDWSTTISMRGFQVSLDEQQLGMTVDGIPNGNSNYGGGSKANRFIDTHNLLGVEVSQGTADIASRSHEALGGSLNFTTSDPLEEERLRTALTVGDHNAQKLYGRYDTGEIAPGTFAWLSYSTSATDTWIDQSGEANRDHIAAKLKGRYDDVEVTGYIAYDDTHEDNYQRVSPGQFAQNPDWDRLTGDWTGIPHIDQLYRRGWSTLRENLLAYIKADFHLGSFNLKTNVYYHDNEGRGDWVPPYIANVTDDGTGDAHSELVSGNTVYGGRSDGVIEFVNARGESVAPIADCESSLTFPYGGTGPSGDPACYEAGALPVGSYRHTHYEKQRYGFNADFDWTANLGAVENTLRGGLWYEDYLRNESRDWHKLIDARTGYHFDHTPYWVQYDRDYPTETLMYYLDDSIRMGPLTARIGAKQFLVDLEREDNFTTGSEGDLSVNTDSDVLLSGGLIYELPIEGLELFYGYAENFAAIKDPVLEAAGSSLDNVEPESAENQDLGLRLAREGVIASLTYYQIEFENRITYIPEGSVSGIDYLNELDGTYTNVGGIESSGIEAALQLDLFDNFNIYTSYTHNESEYLGTGNTDLDDDLGIFVGNTVAGSAEDMLVISANWFKGPYSGGVSVKQVSERWLEAANENELDSHSITDLYFGVDLEQLSPAIQGISVRFNVSNLTDEDYLGGVSGGGAWIGPGRTATASLTMDF